jgi:hypothetical protein
VPVLDAVALLVGALLLVSCVVLCLPRPPMVILIFSPSFRVGMCVYAATAVWAASCKQMQGSTSVSYCRAKEATSPVQLGTVEDHSLRRHKIKYRS